MHVCVFLCARVCLCAFSVLYNIHQPGLCWFVTRDLRFSNEKQSLFQNFSWNVPFIQYVISPTLSPVGWISRIHQLHLCRAVSCGESREILRVSNDRLINFNCISIRLTLFYTQMLGNRVRCTFIIHFFQSVGCHLPFQHNKLFHLPYMAVAEISLRISLRVRPEEPFLLLKYIITLSLILITNSLSLGNALFCKYNYLPHISWFVLLLLLLVFTNQNTTQRFPPIFCTWL